MKKTLGIIALVLVALLATAAANKRYLVSHALGWLTDFKHPRAPNHPVPWQAGPDAAPAGTRPPNVVVILADDLGFNDVSLYGHGVPQSPTPAIEALAKSGVRFDRGYAGNAVCAPSRATLLTGRYSSRFGFEYTPTPGNMAKAAPMFADPTKLHHIVTHPEVTDRIPGFDELGLPPSEVTVAKLLQGRGYHTVHIGKWHLGGTPNLRPLAEGFDESLYMESGLYLPEDSPDVVNSKQEFDPIDQFLWPNMRYATSYNGGPWFEPKGYLTDYYTDEAIHAIHANRNRPFFLYLAHWAVHTPMQASKEDYDALSNIPSHRERVNAAMVRALDRSVARVMQALKDEGLDQNTLVIFTSDNGAPNYIGIPTVNQPYRGWKLTYFEGGLHVPFAAAWPGHIPAGSVYDQPVMSVDILPTALAAAGITPPTDRVYDGVDLLPYLNGQKSGPPHDVLFWRDGSYQVVLARGWKLQTSERPKKEWLFDLTSDPLEHKNLADEQPAKRAELEKLLADHNAQMAQPMWPSFIEMPVSVDKTLDQVETPEDEYVYWQN
ncbi:MAG TPA: sulfatase-like hydrolase/transferase [Nevskiaceae bacterium]|nr:sulfatase-like hydrolase/transferase [Nevskiaceae bacterium]